MSFFFFKWGRLKKKTSCFSNQVRRGCIDGCGGAGVNAGKGQGERQVKPFTTTTKGRMEKKRNMKKKIKL